MLSKATDLSYLKRNVDTIGSQQLRNLQYELQQEYATMMDRGNFGIIGETAEKLDLIRIELKSRNK